MKNMQRPFRKLKWSAKSEQNKVLQNPGERQPVNRQAAALAFPAPWWSKLNDPEFCGEKIAELQREVQNLKNLNGQLQTLLNINQNHVSNLKKSIKRLEGISAGNAIISKSMLNQEDADIPIQKLATELGYDLYSTTANFQITIPEKLPHTVLISLIRAAHNKSNNK